MRLTLHTDYALRLLMLLAIERGSRHTIGEVARRYDISRNHMMKVAQTPTQHGFVESLRGPLAEALATFLATLDRYSLTDLVARPGTLRDMRRLLTVTSA